MLTDTLQQVLSAAHGGHRYVTDQQHYRRPEHWAASLTGDCEDFALWCRQRLAARGIAADLVYCKTENGDGHLVCSVDGWILDNRYPRVMRRDDLDYIWISIGRPGGTWHSIKR